MRTNGQKLEILDNAQDAFQKARTGKLPYLRRAATVAAETDRKLGTDLFGALKSESGFDTATVRDPSSRAAKGQIGKLTDAFSHLIDQVRTIRGNMPSSPPLQCAPPAEEPELPDWLRRAEERLHSRL